MKKFTFFKESSKIAHLLGTLLFILTCTTALTAQVLNQSAAWPNTSWAVNGTYDVNSLISDPTTTANFGYDDDNAGSASTDSVNAESPTIDLSTAQTAGETWITVDYNYNFNLGDSLQLQYYDAASTSWVLWEDLADNSSTQSAWCSNISGSAISSPALDISSFTSTQLSGFKYRFAYNSSGSWGWGFCMSSPTIKSSLPITCLEPSNLTATNLSNTSAELGWTENNSATKWQIEYDTTGFPQGTGDTATITSNPYNISGLAGNTTYEFYVRSICAAGDSSTWAGPFSFRTLCDPFTPEYSYDFTDYLDDCWSEASGRLNTSSILSSGSSNWVEDGFGNSGFTDAAKINIYGSSTDEWIISPSIDLGAGTIDYQVEFDVILTNYNSTAADNMGIDDSLAIVISTNNGATWSSSNIIYSWVSGNQPPNSREYVEFSLAGYTGIVKIGFYAASSASNTDYDISIDNFSIDTLSSCPFPASLSADSLTPTSADVSWLENGTATSWEIVYGLSGFRQDTGNFVVVSSNPATISSLIPLTDYEFYVRSICGPNDSSLWKGPFNFSTPCAAYNAPYAYDFTDYLDECWKEASGRLSTSTTLNEGNSDWVEDGFANVGTTDAARMNIFTTTKDEWIISPSIDLGTGALPYQLEFDVALTDWASTSADNMGSDDTLAVVISTDNGLTWSTNNILKLWVTGDQPATSGEHIYIDLSAYTGIVKFGFYAASSVSNADYDVHIDNFLVDTLVSCPALTELEATNIRPTTADLSWVASNKAFTWQIQYDTIGFTLGAGMDTITFFNPTTVAGLTPNSIHEFYVRAICGRNDTSVWNGPFRFETPCIYVTTYPYLQPFTTFVPECWEEADDGTPTTGPSALGASSWNSDDFLNDAANGDGVTINLYLNNKRDWILSRYFDLSSAIPYEIKLQAGLTDWGNTSSANMGSDDEVHVLISTNQGVDWDTLYTWDISNQPSNTGEYVYIDLTAYSSNENIFAIWATDGTVNDPEDYDFHIDNFEIREIPSCREPSDIELLALTDSTANLNWVENNLATSWEIEYGTSGFNIGSGSSVIVTAKPFSITGLSEQTSYQFYVRSICAAGDSSLWTGPFDFRTPCKAIVGSYAEDFGTSGVMPACWSHGATNNENWIIDDAGGHVGNAGNISGNTNSNGYFAYVDDSTPDNLGTTLESPYIDVSGLTTPALAFFLLSNNEGFSNVEFSVDIWDGSVWNINEFVSNTNTFNGEWEEILLDISHLTISGPIQIRFIVDENNTAGDFYDDVAIDDVRILEMPSCLKPTQLSINSITDSSSVIQWTENNAATQWQIEYDTAGFPQGTGVIASVNSNPITISGLNPNQEYEFYVRSICGIGDTSFWTGPLNLHTECNSFNIPFVETFNDTSTTQNCWTVIDDNSDGDRWDLDQTYTAKEGNQSASMYTDFNNGNNDDYLISPQIELTGNERLGFWYRVRSSFESEDFTVLLSTTGTAPSDFTNILMPVTNVSNTTFVEKLIDLSAYTGPVYIAFYIPPSTTDGWYFYLDNIQVDTIPSCPAPMVLNDTLVFSNSAGLTWLESGTATSWGIQYDTTGFTLGSGIDSITSLNPKIINGLDPNTSYDFYVRALCSINDSSTWAGPFTIVTECAIETTYPYLQDFTSFVPDCWDEADQGTPIQGPSSFGSSSWISSDFANNPIYGAGVKINLYTNTREEWMVSSIFDLTIRGPYELKIKAAVTDWTNTDPASMGSDDEVQILVSTDNGINWVNLHTWDVSNQPSNTGDFVIIDLTSISDTAIFAIWATDGTVNDPEDYDFHIDKFEIREIPSCREPSNLAGNNITTTSADMTWVENNSATQWQIEYGKAGFGIGSGINSITSSNPINLTNLNPSSHYQFYVRSICTAGDTSFWSGPFDFQTLCAPVVSFPYLQDYNVYVPYCWDEADNGTPITGPNNFGDSDWLSGSYLNNTSNGNAVKINLYTNSREDWIISQEFDLSGSVFELSLKAGVTDWLNTDPANMGSDDEVQILASTNNGVSWSNLYTWNSSNEPSNAGEEIIIKLPFYNTTTIFAIWATDGSTNDPEDYDFHIDDFRLREIPAVDAKVNELINTNIDYCNGTFSPIVAIRNVGSDTLLNLKLVSEINGLLDTLIHFNKMEPYQIDTLMFSNIPLSLGNNNISFYTIEPNGVQDQYTANDTLHSIVELFNKTAGLIAGSDTACFGEEIKLLVEGARGDIQWQRFVGGVFVNELNADSTSYQVTIDSTTSFRVVACGTEYSDTLTVVVVITDPPSVVGDTAYVLCGNTGTAVLSASSLDPDAAFNWYDSPTSTAILSTNDTLLYSINTSRGGSAQETADTFYVSIGGNTNIGAPNKGQNTGYTLEAGLFFDVFAPSLTIKGVYVYPLGTGAGTVEIGIRDAAGNLIYSTTVNLVGTTNGIRTYVPLNHTLTTGTDYKLLMLSRSGGVSGLVRDFAASVTGGGFPFTIPGKMSITSGHCCSANTTSTSYYYFYDWEVSTGCESVRVPVIGDVQCEPMSDLALGTFISPIDSNECYSNSENVQVTLWNSGGKSIDFTVDTVDIIVNVSGAATQSLNFELNNNSINSGVLAFEDTIVVNIGNINMSNVGDYNFEAILFMDNDIFAMNDTIRTVISNSATAGNLSAVDTICGSDFVTLSTTGSIGDVQWQRLVGTSFMNESNADSVSYEVFVDSTTTFRLMACGIAISDTLTVTKVEVPLAPSTRNDTVSLMCGISGDAVLIASSGINSSFNWYDAASGGTLIASGDTLFHNITSNTQTAAHTYSDTLYVSETRFGCEGPRGMAIAVISILNPAAPTVSNDTALVFCGDSGTAVLSATSGIAAAGFKWYDNASGGNLISSSDTLYYGLNTSSQTATTVYSDTFYVVAVDPVSSCESPRAMATAAVICTVGDKEMPASLQGISIQPNPSKGVFHLIGVNVDQEMEVSVYNSNGKLVYQLGTKVSNNFNKQIDISALSKGIYFIKFQGERSMEMKKVIIH